MFISCGGESTRNNESGGNENSSSTPDCPTTTITFSIPERDSIRQIIDHSFEVKGGVGSFSNGRLRLMLGDTEYSGDMYDYPKEAKYCLQISIDDAEVKEYDVTEVFVPVQPYMDGSSVLFFGSEAIYGDAKTTGKLNITSISSTHVCGEIDIKAYHGGVLKGSFSSPLTSKY